MFDRVPENHTNIQEWLRKVAQKVNALLDGKTNNVGSFTITANDTTTVVSDLRVGNESVILFMPTTANAATEIWGGGGMYVSSITAGTSFTVTHSNGAQTDRTFKYTLIG